MKQCFKKVLSLLLIFVFLFAISACKNKDDDKKGYDGKVFDISVAGDESLIATTTKVGINYELLISGSGEAKTYEKKELVPWNAISKNIIKVTIEEGITNIGNYYFSSTTLDSYIIPRSVQIVEENSFNANAIIYSYSETEITENCSNKIYYYSETSKLGSDQYWHMVGELPVIWEKYKILFIGNSFTFYPSKVTDPAVCSITKSLADNIGLDVEIDYVVQGAWTLKKFADENDEKGKIVDEKLKASNDYDFVILQEQSTTPVEGYANFAKGVELLIKKVKDTQKDAEVILYATWGFPSGLDNKKFTSVKVMEELIREGYEKCAGEYGLRISHVGKAFTHVYENYKDINLFWTDDKHQGYTGAYLSACVHICTLFNLDITKATFNGELDATTAGILRNTAYEIVIK